MKLRPTAAHAIASLTLVLASTSHGSGWPQYNGPSGDRTTAEPLPLAALQAKDPKTAWTVDTPTGFSSFSVGDGKVFTLVRTTDEDGLERETCIALDASTGTQAWGTPLGVARYDGGGDSGTPDNKGGDGPRSTPSFSEGRVYAIDAQLSVTCLDAASGKELWSHDVIKENEGENIQWKNAASPLVEEDLVLLAGGGKGEAIIALDKVTGKRKWAKYDDKMTHATPVAATIGGTRQVIFFTQEGLLSVLPKNGQELWRYGFPFKVSTAASPVVFEDIVFCSAGYGVGAGAARISGSGTNFKAEEIWRTENDNINHWSTPVAHDGFLYGMFSFKAYGDGPLGCIDIRTGEQKWKQKGFGPGNVILSTASATPTILALSDSGELVAVEARPDAYKELARADVLDGKCWSSPVLADGAIYARSTTEGTKLPLQ